MLRPWHLALAVGLFPLATGLSIAQPAQPERPARLVVRGRVAGAEARWDATRTLFTYVTIDVTGVVVGAGVSVANGVAVGGTDVSVGGTTVFVGDGSVSTVSVGVGDGGTTVSVGGTVGVSVGVGTAVSVGVSVGASVGGNVGGTVGS